MLSSAFLGKAQTNYLLPGGVAGVSVGFHHPYILNMNQKDTSDAVSQETYWFKNTHGGFPDANISVNTYFDNTTTNWVKISCYDFTKSTLLRTVNVAPNVRTFWNFDETGALMSKGTYYWKFENVALQTPQLVADTKFCEAYSTVELYVTNNDVNLPSGYTLRIKPGQTLSGFQLLQTLSTAFQIKAGANPGIYTFKYEVLNGTTIIGEQTVTVNIAAGVDYCLLSITDIKTASTGINIYDVTLSSPNNNINPFNYKVLRLPDLAIVKQGTTPPADDNKEQIDLTGVPTGTYRVVFESTTKVCSAIYSVEHVLASERCSISIPSIDKIPGTNSYKVNVNFSGVSSYKYSSNLNDVSGLSQTASSFTINLDGITSATYSIRVDGVGKTCSASEDIIHYLSAVPAGSERVETYVKLLANYKDNWIIAGTNSKGGTRDYDTQSRHVETATNVTWQSYISDFNNPSNAINAHASISFQKDTARNEPNISVLVTPSKLILQQRSTKNLATTVIKTLDSLSVPIWVRLRKIGNNITAEYSKTASMNPVWTTISTVQNVTNNWGKTYYKTLGVGSTTSNYIAEARFRGHLGGQISFVTQTPNPPTIASVPSTPVAGNNVTFSATGCAGSVNWFANNVGVGAGASLSITNAVSGTVYAAKCTINGKVSTLSSTITIGNNNGLLSCKNGSSFDIASVTATTGTIYSVAFNAANLSSATVKIKNAAGVEQRSYTHSVTSNPTVINAGVLSSGTYTLDFVGLSCNGTASKTFTVVNNNPSCINGSTFDILSVTQGTGNNYSVQFNANNLSNVNIQVKNSSNVLVKEFNSTVVSNPQTFDLGNLSGAYTLVLNGISCQGQASKAFTATGTLQAPEITSSVIPSVVGANMTLTATNCSNTVDWYKNNTYVSSGLTIDIISAVLNDSYKAKCKEGSISSAFSTEIIIQSVGGTTTPPSITFGTNYLKTIAIETQTDKFSVAAFPTIGTKLKSWDATRQIAKYPIIWHSKLTNFVAANKRTWDLGISSPTDIKPWLLNQEGDGIRCQDFILYANPNTGLPWTDGNDPECGKSVDNFTSSRPFQYRVKAEGGTALSMNGWSLERYYDEGVSYTNADIFGYGDKVGNKSNTGFSVTDVENGEHGRFEEIPIVIGMADNTMGAAVSMYNQAINGVFPDRSHYPLDYVNGGYPSTHINLDGTPTNEANNVINAAWNPANKVTITSRGINNKGLIDYPNAWESSEISCYASAAFHQGEEIYYDNNNKSLHRTTNKFGVNRNAEHIIAHTIYSTQVRKWHLRKNFNDRRFVTLAKTLCDRGNIGLTTFDNGSTYVTNEDLQAKHLPRDLAFMKTMFTAFEGSYYYHWDRNTANKNIDGYNGDLFAINLINQQKSLSQGNVSFVDKFDSFDFKLWTAEISYDGGTTWKQEKGVDYIMSQTSIPHAQCITNDGVWAVFLARPENTELKACKLRINYNGNWRYLDITADMWDTTDPAYANTSLSNLPDAAKDFYYNLIDLAAGSSSVNVNAPSIASNPTVPVEGTSVTFTASGCSGTVKWWLSDANVATGLTYTVTNPTANNSYFATCTSNSVTSSSSNTISITANSNTETVQLIVFVGESNAIPKNAAETASAGDYGVRSGVKIWNSNNNTFEQMNVPTNTTLNQNARIADGWGWEVQLANLRQNGTINRDIRIVQTGQGGALIGQFNTDFAEGYWPQLQTKILAAKAAVIAEGKTPIFYVMYSQGINNAISYNQPLNDPTHFPGLSGAAYWQAATLANFANIRNLTGANTKICMTKFINSYGTYLNSAIDNIVNDNPSLNFSISNSGLSAQADGLHFDAASTKTIVDRMVSMLGLANVTTPSPSPTVPVGSVTITEPNQPINHYRSSTGSPDIISRYYLNFDDNVYLENSVMKVGISLRGGGAITYFSKAGSTINVVNNANDGGIGRQIQPDYYQKPTNFSVPGKTTSVHFPNNGYNTTLGGDDFRNVPTLLNYYATSDGYYLKFKPLVWGIDGHISEITMEVLYKLEGNSLKATYTYTSERTDNQRFVPTDGQLSFDGWSIPTLHMNKFFTKIHTYGRLPDQNNSQDITQDLPTNPKNTTTPSFTNLYPSNGWAAIEAPSQNFTLGIINKNIGYVRSERKNIVNENQADDKDDAVTIVEFLDSPPSIDTNLKRVRVDNVYFTLGTVAEIKAKAAEVPTN